MKKVITILVLILAIAVSGFYIYLDFSNKKEEVEIVKQDEVKKEIFPIVKTKEVKIGDMVLNIPENLEVFNENGTYFRINGSFKNLNDDTKVSNFLSMGVDYKNNLNDKNLLIKDWFYENGPQTQKHAKIPDFEKSSKINTIDSYLVRYLAPQDGFGLSTYTKDSIYISYKKNIYEIWNYRRTDSKDVYLTPEEIESIENYEKIVDEIIKSIRFVE